MRIASEAGWVLLNDRPLRAKWLGGSEPEAVVFDYSGPPPYSAISHFGDGILTFLIPYLFRTRGGISLLVRGPANRPKDAIAPLEGVIETDWSVAAVSMHWKFTRPDSWVEFERAEPICMVVPQHLDLLENASPRLANLADDPETRAQYEQWCESFRQFNERLRCGDPDAIRCGWQRYYFNGTAPHEALTNHVASREHRRRLRLRQFAHEGMASPEDQPRGSIGDDGAHGVRAWQ